MIDKKDVKTVDAFPIKKRGRPSTGDALTSAERKRLQRQRDRESVFTDPCNNDFKSVTVTALLENLARCVSSGLAQTAIDISKELVRRAKIASKNK